MTTEHTLPGCCFSPGLIIMCIGVSIITLPPTVACLGYISWYQGADLCLERLQLRHEDWLMGKAKSNNRGPPSQTVKSYAAGIVTLVGSYYMQSKAFPFLETPEAREELQRHSLATSYSSSSSSSASSSSMSSSSSLASQPFTTRSSLQQQARITHQSQISGYRPPDSVMEILYKVTPPLALRISATTVAFFMTGVVQTAVALQSAGRR